jgi:hypothetical protein
MEDLSQSSTEALEAEFFFTVNYTVVPLIGLIWYFAPHLIFALSSVLSFLNTISLCMIEVLPSHGLRLRLPGILRKGVIGLKGCDDRTLRGLPSFIELFRFGSTSTGLIWAIWPLLTQEPSPTSRYLTADCYEIPPNPDIVGLGVRCSIYTLLFCLFISLIVASFHRQQSGTKELGCMVLISTQTYTP